MTGYLVTFDGLTARMVVTADGGWSTRWDDRAVWPTSAEAAPAANRVVGELLRLADIADTADAVRKFRAMADSVRVVRVE
jgi:hypothetical protein